MVTHFLYFTLCSCMYKSIYSTEKSPFLFEFQCSVADIIYLKVNLPRELIKLSPISSAIIPHKSSEGQVIKTGYVKLSTFSQVSKRINYKIKLNSIFSSNIKYLNQLPFCSLTAFHIHYIEGLSRLTYLNLFTDICACETVWPSL